MISAIENREIYDSHESAARSCAPVTCCAYVALCRHGEVECKICLREMLQETEAKLQRERQYSYQLRQTLKDRERKLASRHNAGDERRQKIMTRREFVRSAKAGSGVPSAPCPGSPAPQCRYIISGSEGVCQEKATHVVRTPQNKYPMECCEAHTHTFIESGFKVTKLENAKVSEVAGRKPENS